MMFSQNNRNQKKKEIEIKVYLTNAIGYNST